MQERKRLERPKVPFDSPCNAGLKIKTRTAARHEKLISDLISGRIGHKHSLKLNTIE